MKGCTGRYRKEGDLGIYKINDRINDKNPRQGGSIIEWTPCRLLKIVKIKNLVEKQMSDAHGKHSLEESGRTPTERIVLKKEEQTMCLIPEVEMMIVFIMPKCCCCLLCEQLIY